MSFIIPLHSVSKYSFRFILPIPDLARLCSHSFPFPLVIPISPAVSPIVLAVSHRTCCCASWFIRSVITSGIAAANQRIVIAKSVAAIIAEMIAAMVVRTIRL